MSDDKLTLQERYNFQVEANRSLVEATGKAMDLVAEAAAFLDGLADRMDNAIHSDYRATAADCRAMARKLRGET